MKYKTSIVTVSDGLNIHLHQWMPENPDKLMLIVHGSVEHAKRTTILHESFVTKDSL